MIAAGQVWQNGRTAVKVQKAQDKFCLVIFDKNGKRLHYKDEKILRESEVLRYLRKTHCALTDMILVCS